VGGGGFDLTNAQTALVLAVYQTIIAEAVAAADGTGEERTLCASLREGVRALRRAQALTGERTPLIETSRSQSSQTDGQSNARGHQSWPSQGLMSRDAPRRGGGNVAGILVGARRLGPSFAMWVPQRGRVSGRPPAAAAGVGRGVLTRGGGAAARGGRRPSPRRGSHR